MVRNNPINYWRGKDPDITMGVARSKTRQDSLLNDIVATIGYSEFTFQDIKFTTNIEFFQSVSYPRWEQMRDRGEINCQDYEMV